MKSSGWTVLYAYCLRIACFVCTMYCTFVFPVVPFAVLGWLVLGAFFWQDFFPVTWLWEFESVSAEGSMVGSRGAARDGDTGVWVPEVEGDSIDEAVLDLAEISTEALCTYG